MSGGAPLGLPDPEEIDAVVLDVGGVLLLPHPERILDAFRASGVTHAADHGTHVRAHYAAMAAYDASGLGPDEWRPYTETFLATLGVPDHELDSALAAMDLVFSGPVPELWALELEDSVAAGRRLNAAGVPLAIVSNADGRIAEALAAAGVAQVGAGPGVELVALVDSGVVGVAKPDPRVFAPALDALGVAASRCVYVGDSVRNDVAGARAAGLHPVRLDPFAGTGGDHVTVSSLHAVVDHLGVA